MKMFAKNKKEEEKINMGYTTEFRGSLKFNKEVRPELVEYINKFSETRHMKRENEKIMELYPDWKEHCFYGNLGKEGEFFLSEDDYADLSIVDINSPGGSAPGLWCQWIINNNELQWDGGEKFYNYINWLKYLINNFFIPQGYILNGEIDWVGEYSDDKGKIHVTDNKIEIYNE